MSEKTWFVDFLQALDGHTAASLAEAEEALSQGFKPFDTFMDEVKKDVERKDKKQQDL